MAAPDVNAACIEIPIDTSLDLDPLSIAFPGGFDLQAQITQDVGTAYDAARGLMSQLNGALGPLGPIFLLLNCVLDIKKCLQDVPNVVTDPQPLIQDIEKLAIDIDALAGVAPQLSVPKMLKSILRLLVTLLTGIRQQLSALIAVEQAIELATTRAGTLAALGQVGVFAASQLMVSVGCAKSTLSAQLIGLGQGLGPAGVMLKIVNGLASGIGLDAIPELPAMDDSGADANIAPLTDAIQVLATLEAAIPV